MAISEDIRNGILARLDLLKPELPKYIESIEQGFKEPAFFVLQLDGNQTKEIDRRYKRMLLFDIHYYPSPDSLTKKADCQAMAELFYDQLEVIQVDGHTLRGFNLRHQVANEVLHFFVSYNIHLMKVVEPGTKMQELEQEENVK